MSTRRVDGPVWPERGELRILNHDLPRIDGPQKVSGRARYTHDVRLPGMVWARLVCSPYPSAKVSIDLAPARALPGVVDARGLLIGDDPLNGEARWLGQPVAVVTAETSDQAEDAARALEIEYEELEWVVTRDQALDALAPEIARGGNSQPNRGGGDRELAEKALGDATAVVEATYSLPVQHHVSLETHGIVAAVRGDEAVIYASTQAVNFVANQVAGELGMNEAQVEAIVEHMGGGFGAKFQIGVEGTTACAISRDLQRPVHLMLTRTQEFLMGGNRSGSRQELKGGMTDDGRLVGLVARIERLGGLGRGSHPGQPYIYTVADDAFFTEDVSVLTNTDANRAMRAPGHPQASFAIESLLDELAYELALDPLEVRKKNVPDDVWRRQLDRAAREIGWPEHPRKTGYDRSDSWTKRGIGFAISTWGGGGRPGCGAEVRVSRDGGLEVRIAVQDLGTGVRTMLGAIVAEEFGQELARVRVRIGNSQLPPGVGSGGSVTTGSVSPPVKEAAWLARKSFLAAAAEAFGAPADELGLAPGEVLRGGRRLATWEEACAALGPDGITGTSVPRGRDDWSEISHLQASGVHGVQAAHVEVDVLTGAVQVLKMVAVQDCGLPLNRLAIRSQINGGMIQALSYGLLEERVLDHDLGAALNAQLGDYKIAGAFEIPELVVIIDDEDVGRGPIGIGEPPVIPGHGAIANAIFNACGARLRALPMTPDKVLAALPQRSSGDGAGGAK